MGQNGRSGRAVTGCVIGLGCSLTNQSNTSVLNVVLEFDLFGDGDAVIDDLGSTELLFKNNVATFGAESHSNGLGQDVNALFKSAASVLVVNDALGHGGGNVWEGIVGD